MKKVVTIVFIVSFLMMVFFVWLVMDCSRVKKYFWWSYAPMRCVQVNQIPVIVLKPVVNDLCTIAEKRLTEIYTNWSHEGFDKPYWKILCPSCNGTAENLAQGHETLADAYIDWLKSPGHRKNLDGRYEYSCVATGTYQGRNYYVQVFANIK